MASGPVRTGIRPGTDRHLSIPRSGRSGFGDIRSIPRLRHRSVPKSSRSMSVLDHGQTGRVGPVEVRGIERENVGLWNGYVILYIVQECGVNPLFILCSQTHEIIKLISNIPSVFLNKKLR